MYIHTKSQKTLNGELFEGTAIWVSENIVDVVESALIQSCI